MTDTPTSTPGQLAYEGYTRALSLRANPAWAQMPSRYQHAWEVAAEAAITAWIAAPDVLTPAHEATEDRNEPDVHA